MNVVPENQFAIVLDRERNMIVDSGRFDECQHTADVLNREYQSTAYVVRMWIEAH